jgi:hypothetical protein
VIYLEKSYEIINEFAFLLSLRYSMQEQAGVSVPNNRRGLVNGTERNRGLAGGAA